MKVLSLILGGNIVQFCCSKITFYKYVNFIDLVWNLDESQLLYIEKNICLFWYFLDLLGSSLAIPCSLPFGIR